MRRFSRIILYIFVFIFSYQTVFLWYSFADDCDYPPQWWLCKVYGDDYYIKKSCCVRCEVCSNASLEMQTYINFQVEILWALHKYQAKAVSNSSPFVKWLFSMWTLKVWSNFLKSIKSQLNALSQSAVDVYRATMMSTIMLEKMSTSMVSKDSWWWIFVLFRWKPFVRDRNTLQELDDGISDTMWDIWMAWLWNSSLNENVKSEIIQILEKYSESDSLWSIFDEAKLQGDIKYKHVLNRLYRLNLLMKTFLSVNTTTKFEEKVHEFKREIEKNDSLFLMSLNSDFLTNLSDSYQCGSWSCNTDIITFVQDIKQVWWIKESFSNSMEMIKTANKNLAEAWKKVAQSTKNTFDKDKSTWLELSDQQKELLRTVYWIDASKLSQSQWLWLFNLFNMDVSKTIANWNSTIKDAFSNENNENQKEDSAKKNKKQQQEEYINFLLKQDSWTKPQLRFAKKYIRSKKWDKKLQQKLMEYINSHYWNVSDDKGDVSPETLAVSESVSDESVVENLNETIKNILLQENVQDKKIILNYSNVYTTRYFVEIWAYIHYIVEDVIWTRKNWWIIDNLWKACEFQCSNNWSAWCYANEFFSN